MYSLVGHSVQPSSWDYSPETEAIGWAHSSLGPTADSRQLLWIVHWFVLSLRDRRTDVSVVGCLSCLTTATRIVFIKRAQSIYGHIVVSVLQPQTEAFAPAAQNAERTGVLGFEWRLQFIYPNQYVICRPEILWDPCAQFLLSVPGVLSECLCCHSRCQLLAESWGIVNVRSWDYQLSRQCRLLTRNQHGWWYTSVEVRRRSQSEHHPWQFGEPICSTKKAGAKWIFQTSMHPFNLPVVLRMVAGSWVTRNSHQSANLQPKIWGELRSTVWRYDVWYTPSGDPLTYQHLGTCFCVCRVSVHHHWKRFRPTSPPVNNGEQSVLSFTCWVQRAD